jgi:hypothetical protein
LIDSFLINPLLFSWHISSGFVAHFVVFCVKELSSGEAHIAVWCTTCSCKAGALQCMSY